MLKRGDIYTLQREKALADGLRDVAAELRLIEATDLVAFLRTEQFANIANLVNSSSELAICYAHLDGIAKIVKEEIRAAGGVPFEVRTAAPSDFITGAAKAGSYILAGRDIIANDIEVQVEAALLDGMICLTSCDKTPPGHLMAAARLNIPTILVIGGYQQAGEIDGEPVDVEDVWSGSIGERFGAEPKFPVAEMAEHAIMGPGVCAGMATANTMHSVVEALGMALPGHAPVRVITSAGVAPAPPVRIVSSLLVPETVGFQPTSWFVRTGAVLCDRPPCSTSATARGSSGASTVRTG